MMVKDQQNIMSSKMSKMDQDEDAEDSTTSTNEDKNDHLVDNLEGVYDASKYECPNAPSQVRNLFQFITHYSPQMIEIGPRLKPFIPDYIPTVGHVDAFIKIPHPDGRPNELGLTVLDEPSIEQSDATLLQMKLKALSKEMCHFDKSTMSNEEMAATISDWVTDPVVPLVGPQSSLVKEIDKWIESVQLLHETTSRPESVLLVHQQPDHKNIDNLMQEWPEELETTLNVHSIPTPELDCTLDEYITILLAILDIPIQNNKIASLYLVFTLLNEFQNSQHFNKYNQ